MTSFRHICFLLVLVWSVPEGKANGPPSYAHQVKPFFAKYCLECHTGKDAESSLDLSTYKGLLAGGDHGPALTPGKPDESRIVRMVEGKSKPAMPPKKAKQPQVDEVNVVRAWIAAGAKE